MGDTSVLAVHVLNVLRRCLNTCTCAIRVHCKYMCDASKDYTFENHMKAKYTTQRALKVPYVLARMYTCLYSRMYLLMYSSCTSMCPDVPI